MSHPTISVIIPTYQRAHVIGEALSSVLRQTHQNFELIVVDDGSTDETAQVVSGFDDARIRFVPISHGGRSRARNEGAKRARGDAIVFLDSDDQAEPNWLEELVLALDGPPPVVCCGARHTTMFGEPGNRERTLMPARLGTVYANRIGLFLAGTFAVRRDVFEAVGGYDVRLAFAENSELAIRLTQHCEEYALPFGAVYKPSVWIRRWRGFGGTDDFRSCLEATELILQRHGRRSGRIRPSSWADYRAIAGVNASRLGHSGRAICHLAAAAAARPDKPVHWARLGLSLIPPVARRFWTRQVKDVTGDEVAP
jgi:glycosyltransferase involved in cell wall biosynthesis